MEGEKLCQSVIAVLRNKERFESEIVIFQTDSVFHSAAHPLVRFSYEIPADTFDLNVIAIANVFELVTTKPKV